jgi:hypothetical protein
LDQQRSVASRLFVSGLRQPILSAAGLNDLAVVVEARLFLPRPGDTFFGTPGRLAPVSVVDFTGMRII